MSRSSAAVTHTTFRPLIHEILAASVMLTFAVALPWSGSAQQPPAAPEKRKLSKEQQKDVQTLVAFVDKVGQGQPAPSDVTLGWNNDFLKAQEGRTYVPFTITIPQGTFTTNNVAMYLRVVNRAAAPAAPAPESKEKKDEKKADDKKKDAQFAFEDIHFLLVPGMKPMATPSAGALGATPAMPAAPPPMAAAATAKPADIRVSRAFAVPAGEYDVYIALKEQGEEKKGQPPPKTAFLKHQLTVPNFWTNELTTSTVIVAEKVEPMTAALSQEQQAENPYTLGSTKITPAMVTKFPKSAELSVIFIVYNPQLVDVSGTPTTATTTVQTTTTGNTTTSTATTKVSPEPKPSKKPDVTVEYNFYQKAQEGEKFFNKTSPQTFSAQTLPPQFDLTLGHQLVAGQSVPLGAFPDGDYRLEIKVTDNVAKKSVTRELNFTVGTGPA